MYVSNLISILGKRYSFPKNFINLDLFSIYASIYSQTLPSVQSDDIQVPNLAYKVKDENYCTDYQNHTTSLDG